MSIEGINYEALPKKAGNERVYIHAYMKQYQGVPENHDKHLKRVKNYYDANREEILLKRREAYHRKKERLNMVSVN